MLVHLNCLGLCTILVSYVNRVYGCAAWCNASCTNPHILVLLDGRKTGTPEKKQSQAFTEFRLIM